MGESKETKREPLPVVEAIGPAPSVKQKHIEYIKKFTTIIAMCSKHIEMDDSDASSEITEVKLRPYPHALPPVEPLIKQWCVHALEWNRVPEDANTTMMEMAWAAIAYMRVAKSTRWVSSVQRQGSVKNLARLSKQLVDLGRSWNTSAISASHVDALWDDIALATVYTCSGDMSVMIEDVMRDSTGSLSLVHDHHKIVGDTHRHTAMQELRNIDDTLREYPVVMEKPDVIDKESDFMYGPIHADGGSSGSTTTTTASTSDPVEWKRTIEAIRTDASVLASDFCHLCARTYFEIELQNIILCDPVTPVRAEYPTDDMRISVERSVLRFREWIKKETLTDQLDRMHSLFYDIAFSCSMAIGTSLKSTRSKLAIKSNRSMRDLYRSTQELKTATEFQTLLSNVASTHRTAAIPSSVYDMWCLALFVFAFHTQLHYSHLKNTIIMQKDIRECYTSLICTKVKDTGHPRHPLILQLKNQWYVHHIGKWLFPAPSLEAALMAWCYTLINEFKSITSEGRNLSLVTNLWFNSPSANKAGTLPRSDYTDIVITSMPTW
jgi:hypothetical protein